MLANILTECWSIYWSMVLANVPTVNMIQLFWHLDHKWQRAKKENGRKKFLWIVKYFNPWHGDIFFVALICAFCFLIGLLFCQHSGQYWLQMFDNYCATLPLLFIGFCELVGVSYIYTTERWAALDPFSTCVEHQPLSSGGSSYVLQIQINFHLVVYALNFVI